MTQIWIYSIAAVFVVSIVSLVGIFALGIRQDKFQKMLIYLVSFSAGALLGDVFIHIIPELMTNNSPAKVGFFILFGIIIFFILEKSFNWHHSHTSHDEKIHSVVYLTIFGDALHNFIDGVAIASSFLVSIPLGLATTLAVVLHEIPQELGQYAILVHGGWSKSKALVYNFISALTSVLGAVLVLVFANSFTSSPVLLLSIGAASFIYISMSDLMPELQKTSSAKKSVVQLIFMVLGILIMASLLLLE